jgi:hypothetical protein
VDYKPRQQIPRLKASWDIAGHRRRIVTPRSPLVSDILQGAIDHAELVLHTCIDSDEWRIGIKAITRCRTEIGDLAPAGKSPNRPAKRIERKAIATAALKDLSCPWNSV